MVMDVTIVVRCLSYCGRNGSVCIFVALMAIDETSVWLLWKLDVGLVVVEVRRRFGCCGS